MYKSFNCAYYVRGWSLAAYAAKHQPRT